VTRSALPPSRGDRPGALATADAAWWLDPRARPLVIAGLVLLASGLLHLPVWAIRGGGWEGPLAWRKPILFGISAGLTTLSLGWIFAALPRHRRDNTVAMLTAWAIVLEVALIDLQTWRGVASHFNRATPFDSALYDAMGALILAVTATAVLLTARCFRAPVAWPADMRLAARAGLVCLLVSAGIGVWSTVYGDTRVAAGLAPEIYGRAGVTKFPHGAVIHALQWLPAVAWLARRAGQPTATRFRLVALATGGTACLGGYSLAQMLLGRGRLDATPATAVVLGAGVAALAWPLLAILRTALTRGGRGNAPA